MSRRIFIRYKLALRDKELNDLAELLGIHRQSLYKKLEGKLIIREDEKEKINEYLKLTEKEKKQLWENKL